MKEANIGKTILLEASKIGVRLFRNNVGKCATGEIEWISGGPRQVTVRGGDAVVRNARLFHAGLAEGSADYVGFTPVKITADMVGKTLPVFTSIEAKTATGRTRPKQVQWLDFMLRSGAVAGVARSAEQAVEILRRGPSV